jgi:hypothetical protein
LLYEAEQKDNGEDAEMSTSKSRNRYHPKQEKPVKNGRYLVKFRNPNMPEYDCTEIVFREWKNGRWDNPFYDKGYEMAGWYENEEGE